MNKNSEMKPTIFPFFTPEVENELIEKIETLPKSGIVSAWDPSTKTACYVWVEVGGTKNPIMKRWTIEGPVTRDHAQNAGRHIASIVEKSTTGQSVSIN
ncbi:MAG: hypothetical protein N0C81_10075 [Candidatus Thiodiazotropha lotti]|nr:hypothetical protein [Candidatus Thiodiazotropha lotti]MCW4195565.1 hypothetical protein [Candidatus Thiodiazotropha lotti]